ncbi:MAG: tetratricopeptide repeat protein [Bacteroidetes bacterium]|nr:tetratricopeptide repeat protein [Bacteroidota bacterium]
MKILRNKYLILAIILLNINWYAAVANETQNQIDSLKIEVFKTSNDSTLIHQYQRISLLYREISKDSSLYYSDKYLELARKTKFTKGVAHGYFNKAVVYYQSEDFENSLKNYLSALEIYSQEKDSINISGVYNNLGILHSLGFDKQTAIDYYIKALEISSQINDSAGIANNSNNIGLIYRDLKNYDKAVEYLNRTLEIDLLSGIQEYIAQTYSNIAWSYLPAKEFDKTFKNLSEALNRIDFVKDADIKIEILSCAGEYYLEMNNPDSAIKYIREALDVADRANRKRTMAYTYFLIGRYLMVRELYPGAITHINEAIKLSDSLHVKEYLDKYYEYISNAYVELGDFKNAHANLKKSYAVKDSMQTDALSKSLNNFEKEKEFVRIQSEFQFDQHKKQSEFEKEALKLKFVTWFSVLIILFLIIIIIATINNYRNKSKTNKYLKNQNEIIEQQSEELKISITKLEENEKELEALNATKDKFFSIIAHDLRNPFNVLIGYADLLISEPGIKEDAEKYDKIIKSIYNTAEFSYELLENILTWARSQSGSLTVNHQNLNLSEIVNSKATYFDEMAEPKNMNIQYAIEEGLYAYADKDMLITIIRNLINNAIKFTMPNGKIKVSAERKDDYLFISVSDNGIGINSENQKKLFKIDSDFKIKGTANETGTGLGLILCNEFIKLNGGEIFVESEEGKGSIFTFTLPIAKTDE